MKYKKTKPYNKNKPVIHYGGERIEKNDLNLYNQGGMIGGSASGDTTQDTVKIGGTKVGESCIHIETDFPNRLAPPPPRKDTGETAEEDSDEEAPGGAEEAPGGAEEEDSEEEEDAAPAARAAAAGPAQQRQRVNSDIVTVKLYDDTSHPGSDEAGPVERSPSNSDIVTVKLYDDKSGTGLPKQGDRSGDANAGPGENNAEGDNNAEGEEINQLRKELADARKVNQARNRGSTHLTAVEDKEEEKYKKKNEGLIKSINRQYEECVKKLDDIKVANKIFMKKMSEETDPVKIELNVTREALFEAINNKNTDLEDEKARVDNISNLGDQKQMDKYTEDKTKREQLETARDTRANDELGRIDIDLGNQITSRRKKQNDLELNYTVARGKKLEVALKEHNIKLQAAEDELAKLNVIGDRNQLNTNQKQRQALLLSEITTLRREGVVLTSKKDIFDQEKQDARDDLTTMNREIEQLQATKETLEGSLGISILNKTGGGQAKKNSSTIYNIDDPKKNFKKLKEIQYNIEAICTEIDNKFKVIKSADSEFNKLLKSEELDKPDAEEEETRKKEELDKETEKEIEEVTEEAIKETSEIIEDKEDKEEVPEEKEEEEQDIKIDDSNEMITLRKQIEDQKSSYERINEMLKALISVLEEKYLNKEQENNTNIPLSIAI
jgi:hypothetical protein